VPVLFFGALVACETLSPFQDLEQADNLRNGAALEAAAALAELFRSPGTIKNCYVAYFEQFAPRAFPV
jgi:hypothetical protein